MFLRFIRQAGGQKRKVKTIFGFIDGESEVQIETSLEDQILQPSSVFLETIGYGIEQGQGE